MFTVYSGYPAADSLEMQARHFLEPKTLIQALRSRGIQHVFHANSVETSLSFLRTGNLLSREECERNQLPMSNQFSDAKDKKYGIFNDLFFNFVDLHVRYQRGNYYGPITFKVGISNFEKFLNQSGIQVGVTTTRIPSYWSDKDTVDDRWVKDVHQISWFNHPDIVVRIPSMDFQFLDEILIDRLADKPLFFDQTKAICENCLSSFGINAKVKSRNCSTQGCKCSSSQNIEWPERYRIGKYRNIIGPFDDVA